MRCQDACQVLKSPLTLLSPKTKLQSAEAPFRLELIFTFFFKPPIRPQRRQFIGAIRSRRLIFSNCCESGLKAMVSIHVHGLYLVRFMEITPDFIVITTVMNVKTVLI